MTFKKALDTFGKTNMEIWKMKNKKIIVIGCPGSGKSWFSRELNRITHIPLFHLDMLFWNPDKTTVDKAVFIDRLHAILGFDEWIIDGNYGNTMELRMKNCDTVFFLDYPLEVCLEGVNSRRGKPRFDLPWVETEEDQEFIEFITNYNQNSRPKVFDLFEKYSDKNIIIFKNRDEANDYLENLAE